MEQWIETALGVCDEWKDRLSKASSSDGDAEDFLSEHGSAWARTVKETFGTMARKAVLKVGNPTVRNRLLKSIVAVVDVTKRLPQASEATGGPALALLQLHTELQRIETGLKKFKRRSLSATPVPGHRREAQKERHRKSEASGGKEAIPRKSKDVADEGKAEEELQGKARARADANRIAMAESTTVPLDNEEKEANQRRTSHDRKRRGRRRSTLPPPSSKKKAGSRKDVGDGHQTGPHPKENEPTPESTEGPGSAEMVAASDAGADHEDMAGVSAVDVPMLPSEDVELEASGPVIPIDAEDLIEEIEEVDEEAADLSEEADSLDGDTGEVGGAETAEPAKAEPIARDEDLAALEEEENAQTLDGISNAEKIQGQEDASTEDDLGRGFGEEGAAAGSAPAALEESEVEIHPVDLTDDSLLDQPVLPLKKRKEGSGLVRVDIVDVPEEAPLDSDLANAVEGKGPERAILPEEVNRLAGQDARIALLEAYVARLRASRAITQKQSAILEQVVTLLGSALPHEPADLARTLEEVDHLYRSDEAPSKLPADALQNIEQRIRGLLDAMRQVLHEAREAADLQGLDFTVGPVTALSDASELPASMLAIQLVESMSRWRLPADLLYVRGPARFFEIRVQANKSMALSWPVPENRLEFGLIGDLDEILVYALHLIEPSVDRPLGETATAGLPGAGVFYQISVPSDVGGASMDAVRTFAISETGRFLQALRRHVVRTT